VLCGVIGGALGGLLHAVATVTFGVDHVVSGVAINIIALGVTRYLATAVFTGQPGASASLSPPVNGNVGRFTQNIDSFTATEQGSGRYSIDIPALGAGKWTMRIQIGSPADTADYSFTVSP
jgi:ABC-type uncharacterized transport system permease subunit